MSTVNSATSGSLFSTLFYSTTETCQKSSSQNQTSLASQSSTNPSTPRSSSPISISISNSNTSPSTPSDSQSGSLSSGYYAAMTSILTNIGVNFTRSGKKKAPASASPQLSSSPPTHGLSSGLERELAERLGYPANGDLGLTFGVSEQQRATYEEYGNLVKLPPGFDRHEWLAYHASFLVRFSGMLWMSSSLPKSCQCPTMSAPQNTIHTMIDERFGKKSQQKHPARTFIEICLHNLENIVLKNEDLFPTKYGNNFSQEFDALVSRCVRSVYCILTHLLHAHFVQLQSEQLSHSLLQLLSYTLHLSRQFRLIDNKDLACLDKLERVLCLTGTAQSSGSVNGRTQRGSPSPPGDRSSSKTSSVSRSSTSPASAPVTSTASISPMMLPESVITQPQLLPDQDVTSSAHITSQGSTTVSGVSSQDHQLFSASSS